MVDDKSECEDNKVVLKFQHKGSMLVVPLNFYGTEDTGVERLLCEFLSISFLLEHIPAMDALDQAREMIRRIESWLLIQDKGVEGYATPFEQHLHPSMERYAELYLMATCCPWGYSECSIPCKFLN